MDLFQIHGTNCAVDPKTHNTSTSCTTMVVAQASKLSFPSPCLSSITSLQFDPHSASLALMHSDSSISLYPSLSPLSLSSLPRPPQTLIHPPSSSSCFILLQNSTSNTSPRALFLVAAPYRGGSKILLRFFMLHEAKKFFSRAQVVCTHKGIQFDSRLGVLLDVNHGVSIKLAGGINYFALYSVSSLRTWVFGVKLVDETRMEVKLIRCAVIDCCKPVWSMSILFGFLFMGEDDGVRVFNLRALAKGKFSRMNNGKVEEKITNQGGVKKMPTGFRQHYSEGSECFITFTRKDGESMQSMKKRVKAVSIQGLTPKKFLIVDSTGDLHVLCLANSASGSNLDFHMRQLPHIIKVQKLAILYDTSSKAQMVWVSDLYHSVHALAVTDVEAGVNKNDDSKYEENLVHISVIQAIFTAEKVQDVVSFAGNGIFLLGQGIEWSSHTLLKTLHEYGDTLFPDVTIYE